jgi:hypothetical protein
MQRPHRPSYGQLAKVGIILVWPHPLTLRCVSCGIEWQISKPPRGRRPNEYWKCTNGCNAQPRGLRQA